MMIMVAVPVIARRPRLTERAQDVVLR